MVRIWFTSFKRSAHWRVRKVSVEVRPMPTTASRSLAALSTQAATVASRLERGPRGAPRVKWRHRRCSDLFAAPHVFIVPSIEFYVMNQWNLLCNQWQNICKIVLNFEKYMYNNWGAWRPHKTPCFPRGLRPLDPPTSIAPTMNHVRHDTCTTIIVHACTMIIVHPCTMIIVHACTMILVHAGTMIIVHACTMIIVHAFTMIIVHAIYYDHTSLDIFWTAFGRHLGVIWPSFCHLLTSFKQEAVTYSARIKFVWGCLQSSPCRQPC